MGNLWLDLLGDIFDLTHSTDIPQRDALRASRMPPFWPHWQCGIGGKSREESVFPWVLQLSHNRPRKSDFFRDQGAGPLPHSANPTGVEFSGTTPEFVAKAVQNGSRLS